MNSETGNLITEKEFEKLPEREKKKHIRITAAELDKLKGMNRHQRRAWAAKKKKLRGKFGSRKVATAKARVMCAHCEKEVKTNEPGVPYAYCSKDCFELDRLLFGPENAATTNELLVVGPSDETPIVETAKAMETT